MPFRLFTAAFVVIFSCYTAPFVLAQNVGIGLANPNAKLHVRGNVKIDSNYVLEFGSGLYKEANAGKIGYQAFTNALDIVGAGPGYSEGRRINFFNEGGSKFTGNIGIRTLPGDAPLWVKIIKPVGSGPSNEYSNGSIGGPANVAQTFTLTDSFKLSGISLNFVTTNYPVLYIREGNGYGGNLLFTKTFEKATTGGYYVFQINPLLFLPPGQYTFIVADSKDGTIECPTGPGYAGGGMYADGYAYGGDDLLFAILNNKDNSEDALFISRLGDVGINTTQPTANLHVAGSFKLNDGSQGEGKILVSDADGNATWQQLAGINPWTNSGTSIYNNNLGNVGIHKSQPTAALHVNGNIKIDSANLLEFGAGLNKEANAGKIGYQKFSTALDIIGAGSSQGSRKIKFWAEGGSEFVGGLQVNGLTKTDSLKVGSNASTFKRIVAGKATLGTLDKQSTLYVLNFNSTFTTIPSVIATPLYEDGSGNENFQVTIRSISATGFSVIVTRTDAASGWTKPLKLSWMAWE